MSFENERRQHRRYPLRLAIKLHRDNEVLDADIINASASGCLLLSKHALEPGQVLEASIPELMIPRTRLHILRCQAAPSGFYLVAAYFDAAMTDAGAIAWISDEHPPAPNPPHWLN